MEGLKCGTSDLGKSFNYFAVHSSSGFFITSLTQEAMKRLRWTFQQTVFFSPIRKARKGEGLFPGRNFAKTTTRNNRVTDNSARPHLFDHGRNISPKGKLCWRNSYRFSLTPTPLCEAQPSPPPSPQTVTLYNPSRSMTS